MSQSEIEKQKEPVVVETKKNEEEKVEEEVNIEYESDDKRLFVQLTSKPLDINQVSWELARHESCGAVSTFIGTTRDNFNGRPVVRLEYESYGKMAMHQMKKIGHQYVDVDDTIHKLVIVHRVGVVHVKEASVVIAVASEHRRNGLDCCSDCIDQVKASVPIWKKEFYADGTSERTRQCTGCAASKWKKNSEWKHGPEAPKEGTAAHPPQSASAHPANAETK